jgi:dTDP-4-dehydrorhamnose 3,5-epimerase
MKINKDFKIEGLIEFQPNVFGDSRGQFIETFNEELLRDHGFDYHFKQDNQSISSAGVFRGIHLQSDPYAQGKLVRVAKGSAMDYAVDLRPKSKTFGRWEAVLLTSEKGNQFWIPPGFGHAFLALEDETIFCYKCTELYAPNNQVSIRFDCPDIGLALPPGFDVQLSEKDKEGLYLPEYASYLNNKGGSFI